MAKPMGSACLGCSVMTRTAAFGPWLDGQSGGIVAARLAHVPAKGVPVVTQTCERPPGVTRRAFGFQACSADGRRLAPVWTVTVAALASARLLQERPAAFRDL